MANIASCGTSPDGAGELYVKGKSDSPQLIATLWPAGSLSGAERASIIADRLNAMFGDPDKYWFEFCTPGMTEYPTYSVIIVPNVKRGSSPDSTWYSTVTESIMDVGPSDASAPWYQALVWTNRLRSEIVDSHGFNPKQLFAPAGAGIDDTTYVYRSQPVSYYGAGEQLNASVINGEIFHPCDLTVATRVRYSQSEFSAAFSSKGSVWVRVYNPVNNRIVICRQNDWGPADGVFNATCRTIDMSAGGAKAALDTDTGFCDRGSKVDFRFLD